MLFGLSMRYLGHRKHIDLCCGESPGFMLWGVDKVLRVLQEILKNKM